MNRKKTIDDLMNQNYKPVIERSWALGYGFQESKYLKYLEVKT